MDEEAERLGRIRKEFPDAYTVERTPLDMVLLAAWCNVPVEKLPDHPTFRTYPSSQAEAGWKRVGEAALKFFEEC